ncbi:MAG: helix-turn-helix domain-containing protein [Acidobacteria bacterium]|nr:helix-turn-helix domain-containing protein [Acidobacteriota bacterium]
MESGLELIPRSITDLSRARRACGFTLEEVARRSRVPEALLRQLELGDLRNWPTGFYARTQIVRYARAAGLDEQDVLAVVTPLLEQRVGPPDLDATHLFPAEDGEEEPFPSEDKVASSPVIGDASPTDARPGGLIFETVPAPPPIPVFARTLHELVPKAEEFQYRPADRPLLRTHTAAGVPPSDPDRHYVAGTIAATCIALMIVAAAGWWALSRGAYKPQVELIDAAPAAVPDPAQPEPPPAPETPQKADSPGPAPVASRDWPSTPFIGAASPPVADNRTVESAARATPTSGQKTQPTDQVALTGGPATPASRAFPPPVVPAADPPSPPASGTLEAMALPSVDVTAPPPAVSPAPSPVPVPAPPPPPRAESNEAAATPRRVDAAPSVDPRTAVRAALQRYEAAYSDLDARAARAVWPAVDERALARAFDGLASQRVSLEECDVVVNGSRARATCSGRAAWIPKVGGGERTASRRWAFELKSADGGWQIVRADAR